MKRPRLWIASGIVVGGGAVYRALRRKTRDSEPDPAHELRRKLDESRSIVEERDQFESAEVPIDRAEPGIDERRRDVHERGRTAIDEMRGTPEE